MATNLNPSSPDALLNIVELVKKYHVPFPHLVSYSRFVELEGAVLLPLAAFLATRFGQCTGLSFIDSTPLKVCHNLRIGSHNVFKGVAQRGVSSTG
jgi:hypothetical protein